MAIGSLRSLVLTGERHLNKAVVAAAGLMLVIASAAGMFQVFSRFVLHMPSTWSEPLVKVSLIWMVYLGLMAGARSGGLIAVNFLYDLAPGRARAAMRFVIAAAILLLLGVLVLYGWRAVYMVRNQTIAGLGVSASWVYSAIPVGAGFAALAVIANYLDPADPAQPR